jgi:two-component system sensor histidine kinase PilS (NtrC family)
MTAAEAYFYHRIKWISFFRVIIAFLSLLLVIYWKSRIDFVEQPNVFYKILFLIFFLSLIYAFFIKKKLYLGTIAIFQIAFDLILISLVVAYTGGIDSPLIFFYAFIIMGAGRLFGKSGAYIGMALSVIFLGFVFLAQYFKLFPFDSISSQRIFYFRDDFYYTYSVFSLGFLILGLLIGYLSQETSKMQKEIVEQEAKYYDLEYLNSAIVNSLNSGLIVFSKGGNITFMNEIARKIIKKIDNESNVDAFKENFKNEIEEVIKKEQMIRGDKKVFLMNNNNMWLGYSIVPLYDHNKESIGVLLNFQDITLLKEMEERIRINDKFAFMGRLSAFLAHEIRNPLASLKGGIEFLVESSNLDDDSKKVSDILFRELDRLNKIITDFLYYTRISRPEKTNIYLKNLIDEIWFELKFMNKENDRFNCFYEGDEDLVIRGDANQIRQVFINLFLNSIDAMKKNGGTNIYVKTCKNDSEVLISVEDEGGGISEEDITKVFDPFFSTKESGTGVGLSIVYKIIEEHDGFISVKNGEKGAVFTMRFPNE